MALLEKVLIRGGLLKGARYSVREYANREVLNREVNSHRYFENGDCHLSLKFGIFGQRHLQNGSSSIVSMKECAQAECLEWKAGLYSPQSVGREELG